MVLELIQTYPRTSIILISAAISFFISLVNYFVLDKDKVKESKKRQKELQAKIKEHKNDPAKAMEFQKEMMGHAMESMKHSMKPMFFTLIPVLVVFWWMKDIFAATEIVKSWIWYYIVSAIIFSMIFRKLLKLP